MTLTEEDDKAIRGFAQRKHQTLGEDAYHDAICSMLERKRWEEVKEPVKFYQVAVKYALIKIFRHEASERRMLEAHYMNDPIPRNAGLIKGRERNNVRREWCRKNKHRLIDGNLIYINERRTCRACKRERERKKYDTGASI